MGRRRRAPRNAHARKPSPCPLCAVPLADHARCALCGAQLLPALRYAAVGPRLLLAGTATAVSADAAEPAAGGEAEAPRWRHTHDLALRTGCTVRVLCDDDTERFCDPATDPAAAAVEAAAVGELCAAFAEHHGGLRDAAQRVHLLHASALSLGPGAQPRLQRGLEHRDLLADAAAHSMAAADEHDRRHTEALSFEERGAAAGGWEVTLRWSEGSFGKALLLLQLVLTAGSLGALMTWQLGKTAGPWSFFWWLALLFSLAFALAVAAAMLTAFRSSTIALDPRTLRTRDLPLPWPVARTSALPVSELSHLVERADSLHAVRFGGAELELLPWADDRDRAFLRTLLTRRLELSCHDRRGEQAQPQPAPAPPPTTTAGRLWVRARRPLRRASYALVALLAVPLLGSLMCPFAPGCMLTGLRPVWLEAQRRANACPKVTERLGADVTWAFGQTFTRDLEDGYGWFAVKGDQRRGKLTLRFAVPVSEGVHLKRADITVGDETVCVICCAVYGEDPQHSGGRRRR